MSGLAAIAATGQSLQRLLVSAFAERSPLVEAGPPLVNPAVGVELANNARLAELDELDIVPNLLTLYLYRVDVDKAMRAAWSAVGAGEGRGRLALNLHYLLTAWGSDALHEQRILGRALQALEVQPVLSGPLLLAPAGLPADEPEWQAQEAIHLGIEELSTEALMRIFDTLPCDYRLSVPYCARVVRIDARRPPNGPPVLDAQLRVHPLRVEVNRP
jgi:Pvc16 N-terminal domain